MVKSVGGFGRGFWGFRVNFEWKLFELGDSWGCEKGANKGWEYSLNFLKVRAAGGAELRSWG